LLVLGAITEAGAGCACPEGAFLKALLRHTILQRREIVFVDLAAGVEFMGRASIQGIDALVVVIEPGSRSIETAKNIVKMARELGIGYIGAIANKITDPSQIDVIKTQLKEVDLLGSIYYSQSLQDADLQHAPAYGADAAVIDQLKESKQLLIDHIRRTS
jgi:CO dehydrogenase maturation factor